jgi:hypothetical protein
VAVQDAHAAAHASRAALQAAWTAAGLPGTLPGLPGAAPAQPAASAGPPWLLAAAPEAATAPGWAAPQRPGGLPPMGAHAAGGHGAAPAAAVSGWPQGQQAALLQQYGAPGQAGAHLRGAAGPSSPAGARAPCAPAARAGDGAQAAGALPPAQAAAATQAPVSPERMRAALALQQGEQASALMAGFGSNAPPAPAVRAASLVPGSAACGAAGAALRARRWHLPGGSRAADLTFGHQAAWVACAYKPRLSAHGRPSPSSVCPLPRLLCDVLDPADRRPWRRSLDRRSCRRRRCRT